MGFADQTIVYRLIRKKARKYVFCEGRARVSFVTPTKKKSREFSQTPCFPFICKCFLWRKLSLHASAAVAACQLFDLCNADAVKISLDRVLECRCGNRKFNC